MRLAFISDIHGHAVALEAVLADLAHQAPVDLLLCLGDVATIGPQPAPVVARLRNLKCASLMGNHDEALLYPDRSAQLQIAPPLLPAQQWCADQLTADDWAYLRSFQPMVEIELGPNTGALCFHGTPHSNVDQLLSATPADELNSLFAGRGEALFVGGHTHIQMLRQHNGKFFLNPGSVGSAFARPTAPGVPPALLPWAEYAIVSWENGAVSVDLRRVPFSLAAFREAVVQSDSPLKGWWLQQYPTS